MQPARYLFYETSSTGTKPEYIFGKRYFAYVIVEESVFWYTFKYLGRIGLFFSDMSDLTVGHTYTVRRTLEGDVTADEFYKNILNI